MHFVAYAAEQPLKHQTIKSYLSAVHHLQISMGGGEVDMGTMPLLSMVLSGVKRVQSGQAKRTRLPITPAVLLDLLGTPSIKLE